MSQLALAGAEARQTHLMVQRLVTPQMHMYLLGVQVVKAARLHVTSSVMAVVVAAVAAV